MCLWRVSMYVLVEGFYVCMWRGAMFVCGGFYVCVYLCIIFLLLLKQSERFATAKGKHRLDGVYVVMVDSLDGAHRKTSSQTIY